MSDEDGPTFVFSKTHPDAQLSREYKASPSIENYLKLRKANLNKEIEIAITGGIEWLLANEELVRERGIDPAIIASALDANHEAISKLSLLLLENPQDREKLEQAGTTHITSRGEGISDALVNYLVAMMLDALSWNNELEIPRDLIVLARHQLLGSEKTLFDKKLHSRHTRFTVVSIAANFLERGETISMRQIAKILKKNVTTISRMFPDNSLEEEATQYLDTMKTLKKSDTPFADLLAEHKHNNKR